MPDDTSPPTFASCTAAAIPRTSRWLPWVTAALVLSAGLVIGLALGKLDVQRMRTETQGRAIIELTAVQAQLDRVLKEALRGTEGLIHLIQHQGGLTDALFDSLASQAIATHRQIRQIGYAPRNVITKVYPLAGNERALGLDYRTIPAQWVAVERARETGEPVLGGPVDLVQGGHALIVRAPVVLQEGGSYWGTVSIIADVEHVLRDGGILDSRTLRIAVRGRDGLGEHGEMITGDPAIFDLDPVKAKITVPGGSWVVAAVPVEGWPSDDPTSSSYFRLAMLNALIFAVLGGLLVGRHGQLRLRHAQLLDESEQRRNAQRALRDSEKMLNAIVESAPTLIHVSDLDGRLLLCNRHFETAIGRSRADIVGQPRDAFLAPDAADEHRRHDMKVIADGTTLQFEETIREADGEHVYLTTKCPLPGEHQQTVAVVGMSIEITQRKRSEEALQLASTIVESALDGVIVTDAHGSIIATNPAFTEITGYSADDARGRTPRLLKSDRHGPEFYQQMWASIAATGEWQGEIWNRRKNGEIFPEWLTISSVRDGTGGVRNYVAVFSDISTIKRTQADLERLAHFDPLTGLPNRVLFQDRMQHAIDRAQRYGHQVAVLLLDLDGFKLINDSLGHPVGDQLLQLAARRLTGCVRAEDTVARLGGDEFAVILSELADGADAVDAIQRILASIQQPFEMADGNGMVTTSVGLAVFPGDGRSVTELVRNADAAMYEAKNAGRNTYRFYQRKMTDEAQQRLNTENALRRALEHGEFEVWFQPQFHLADGAYLGAEALVRWRDPERGLVSPAEFIPVAERSGLIIPLGEVVLDKVGAAARRWFDLGLDAGCLAINVAGPQIDRSDFVASLRRVIDAYALPPGCLEIEITETVIMENPDHGAAVLDQIQALGVTTAIDDFGTGYSSLAYLKELPIDTIKLDRAFVKDLPDDRSDVAISRAVIAMSHNLGFKVIAEGLETEAQRRFLLEAGCDEAQGYLFARPMPIAEFEQWLVEDRIALQSAA